MNGRQIEIFHTVMKTGTVTEAANRLGISQPAVTSSLKQIETSLGFNLFHRTAGRLQPTAEARILNNEAERIQGSLDVFRMLAERLKKDLTQHLRIATPYTFSHELIPQTISAFMGENKDCLIDVTTQHHDQILQDLSGDIAVNNLGFTFGVERGQGGENIAQAGSMQLGHADIVALVPKDWSIANRRSIGVDDLVVGPLVGTFPGEPLGNAVDQYLRSANIEPEYAVRVHNHSLAASLVSKGVGATIIDSITAHYARSCYGPDAFSILSLNEAPKLPITAVYSYQHPLNDHARLFVETFRRSLAGTDRTG